LSAIEGDRPVRLSRRSLLTAGAVTAAAATAPASAEAKGRAYPRLRVISLDALKVNRGHTFDYPLKGDTSVLIDMGRRVPGGVGPKRSIVAYSAQCQHMGSIIQGVAMRPLPKIRLQVRNGAVFAIGVDGLIYGRRSNLAPGKKVGGRS
jgi:arsenite oxidase small subunit